MNTFDKYFVSSSLPERGEGHDSQDEPAEDQFCDPQQRPLDWPSLLQPHGRQPDLQGDEEDGEEDLKMLIVVFSKCPDPLLCRAAVKAVTVVRVPQPGVSPLSVSHQPSFVDEANALLIPIILWSVALMSSGDGPSWHTPPRTPLLWEALRSTQGANSNMWAATMKRVAQHIVGPLLPVEQAEGKRTSSSERQPLRAVFDYLGKAWNVM